jgi:hypothetical protein
MLKSVALLVSAGVLAAAAPAQAIDVVSGAGELHAAAPSALGLASLPLRATLPVGPLSELPEPEVFAMMLLGLVLIGYRASRDSDEKFT